MVRALLSRVTACSTASLLQHGQGAFQGLNTALDYFVKNDVDGIGGADVFVDQLGRMGNGAGQLDAKFQPAFIANGLAEAHHAGAAHRGPVSDFSQGHADHIFGIVQYNLANAFFGRREGRKKAAQSRQGILV